MVPELVARFTVLIQYDPLTLDDLVVEILADDRVSPLSMWRGYFPAIRLILDVGADALNDLAQRTIGLGLGARGLQQVVFPALTRQPAESVLLRDSRPGQEVRAVTHHALPALAAEAERRPADHRSQQAQVGLRQLDSALARQREGRLAAAETHSDGPIASLLGPAPHQPGSLRSWRRAATAILDYRDTAGLFDHDTRDPDRRRRAIGDRPSDPARADHYDRVVSIVQASRHALVLADLANYAEARPPRPDLRGEQLSARSLRELEHLRLKAPVSDEEQRRLPRAIEQRAAALRLGVLTQPPGWVVDDVASRLTPGDAEIPVAFLASAYMDTVVRADRLGLEPAVAWSEALVELAEAPTQPAFAPMGLDF